MNAWPHSSSPGTASPETSQPVSSASVRPLYQWRVRGEFKPCQSSQALSRPSQFLRLQPLLAGVLFLAALIPSIRAQTSVTLGWDPSSSDGIAAYRLYEGGSSRTYTNVIAAGNTTTATASNLVSGATYFFAVTAVDTNGLESDYSSEVSYTAPLPTNNPPAIALDSPANGAAFTAPATISLAASVTANGHTISQVQFYNGATLLGTAASAPYTFSWNNVSAGTYSLSAMLVYDSGSTLASAAANVTVAAAKPPSGLTFAADSGTITGPFVDSNGTLSQSATTGLTGGGRAVYSFNIVNAGNYLVTAKTIAPSEGQNSLYVNIDAEPTDPLMIWDVPVSATMTNGTVSWRGNGNGDPGTAQYVPKVFNLSVGTHRLIILGREANTTLGAITIAARAPRLRIGRGSSGTGTLMAFAAPAQTPFTLAADGSPGQVFSVLSSQDLVHWAVIGTMTMDDTGAGEFTDPASSTLPRCFYRLQEQ